MGTRKHLGGNGRLGSSVAWIVALVAASEPAQAQCTPQWDQHFPSGDLNNGSAACFLPVDDGGGSPMLYAGGGFTLAGGTSAASIAAWDGTAWSALGSGTDGFVRALALFDDDGPGPNPPALIAGGGFTTAGGVAASDIARWDGSSWSALGAGIGGFTFTSVYALAVFDDDGPGPNLPALYAGGNFSTAGGAPANGVATWNGSSWSPVGGGMGPSYTVHALAVFDDDGPGPGLPALYAGGNFAEADGVPANGVARWDGSAWSGVGGGVSGASERVYALLAFDADGAGPGLDSLYAGGSFNTAGGVGAMGIARWDGAAWSALGSGINQRVESLAGFDADGAGANLPRLVAGGTFTFAGGAPANSIAQWDGSSWSTLGEGSYSTVGALAVFDADGAGPGPSALFAGGNIWSAPGVPAGTVARWDGATWSSLGRGTSEEVYALTVHDDDGNGPGAPALYAGGRFTRAGSVAANRIARWDGSSWSALGSGVEHPLSDSDWVTALAVFDADGTGPGTPALYAGGNFTMAGGASANYVARWDGSAWLPLGSGTSDVVSAFAVFDEDGSGPNPPVLFVGGSFVLAGGVPANRIARWNGAAWSGFGSGMNGVVVALTVYDGDGSGPVPPVLCAAGNFTTAGGVTVNGIARWNGTSWSSFGTGMNGSVFDVVVLDQDDAGPNTPFLFAAGGFTTAGGVTAVNIARWNGAAWLGVGGGVGVPGSGAGCLAVFDDDGPGPGTPDLYVGGTFNSVGGGVPASRIAKWNGSSWSTLSTGADHDVNALAVFDEDGSGPVASALYMGGRFQRAGGLSAERIARWLGCGSSITSFCFGDGTGAACPCGNSGVAGRGCQNSAGTGGARLTADGSTGLAADTLSLHVSSELPSALTIVLQGNASIAPVVFGDGLRCAGGSLKRLYVRNASGGALDAPTGSELPVSSRSAALGDPIAGGGVRVYQTYYRDPSASFCPDPPGKTWNASNGVSAVWTP